ncbi:MAG: NAD-dependent epimerase/dehydratase family protein [Parcubacteria group bacterium]
MAKKILITGGAGFIGSHLAKKLKKSGYEIVLIDRFTAHSAKLKRDRLKKLLHPGEYTFYEAELSDLNKVNKIFKNHKFDLICHLAAKTNLQFNSRLYNRTNTLGTINIFELAKDYDVPKVVFASSSMVYGNNDNRSFGETDNTDRPLSIYAASKKSAEILAYTYHSLHKIEMVGLRFFTTYGPWGRPETAISKFTEQIINNQPIVIQNFGKIKKDFTYIDDVINGITASIEKKFNYELINLGSGKSVELETIIDLIEKNLKIKAQKKYTAMQPGDQLETRANIEKAKKMLNYRPKITIEQGIKKYINWYKQYYSLK